MRKTALLVAAALVVSAPIVASMPTLTFAAAKAKAKKGGSPARVQASTPEESNSAFWRALNDLMVSLGQPWPADGGKAGKGSKAKRTKKG